MRILGENWVVEQGTGEIPRNWRECWSLVGGASHKSLKEAGKQSFHRTNRTGARRKWDSCRPERKQICEWDKLRGKGDARGGGRTRTNLVVKHLRRQTGSSLIRSAGFCQNKKPNPRGLAGACCTSMLCSPTDWNDRPNPRARKNSPAAESL